MRIKYRMHWLVFFLVMVTVPYLTDSVHADIKFFDLTNPFLRKIPMAVPVFRAQTPLPNESEQVIAISDQVSNMLEFTGY